jgi:hypothetical protein
MFALVRYSITEVPVRSGCIRWILQLFTMRSNASRLRDISSVRAEVSYLGHQPTLLFLEIPWFLSG